jgi:hypothetical protein
MKNLKLKLDIQASDDLTKEEIAEHVKELVDKLSRGSSKKSISDEETSDEEIDIKMVDQELRVTQQDQAGYAGRLWALHI